MLTLTTPPRGEPVSLPALKAALRIDHDTDDELLGRMAATARRFVERRLDLVLMRQEWTLSLDRLPGGPVPLRPGEVAGVTGGVVRYEGGAARPLAEGEYALRPGRPARIVFDLPPEEDGAAIAELTLRFEAGWADADAVPPELAHAVTLLTAHYHEEREPFVRGRHAALPHAVQAHVEAFREVRL